jgi:hypothetical protein
VSTPGKPQHVVPPLRVLDPLLRGPVDPLRAATTPGVVRLRRAPLRGLQGVSTGVLRKGVTPWRIGG